MEKRTFDRNDIDYMKSNQSGAQAAREIEGVGLRGARVIGSIDADQDLLDHRLPALPVIRDTTGRTRVTRGFEP